MLVLDHNDQEIRVDAVYDWWIVALISSLFCR